MTHTNLYQLWPIYSLLWISGVNATCEYKLEQSARASAELSYFGSQSAKVNTLDPYPINAKSYLLDLQGKSWSFKHEYTVLDYPSINNTAPITNGHLHSLALGYSGEKSLQHRSALYWQVLPTLAVSSNQLKNTDKIEASSYRLEGHLIWRKNLRREREMYTGLCATSLNGEYELIPVLVFRFQYPNSRLQIGYPHSRWIHQLQANTQLFASWGVQGRQWQVLDKNLENRSDLHFSSNQLALGFRYKLWALGDIEAIWLYNYNQQLKYLTQDQTWISADIQDSKAWMVKYIYLFNSN